MGPKEKLTAKHFFLFAGTQSACLLNVDSKKIYTKIKLMKIF